MPIRLTVALAATTLLSAPAWVSAADLLSVYRDALANDKSYQIATHQHAAAQQGIDIARSAQRPTASLSVVTTVSDNSRLDENSLTAALTGRMALYNRTNALRVDAAESNAAEADADLDAAEQSLALRAAQLYFAVLRARDATLFARAELDAFERQLEQTEGRFEVGLVAITDVKEAQAGYDSAQAGVITAENDLATALQALKVTTGRFPDDIASLRDDIELSLPQPANVERWVTTAADHSPEIRAARESSDSARADLRIARASTSPTLDLEATLSETASDVDLNDDFGNRSLRLTFGLPLYTGGSRAATSRQARQLLSAAEQQLQLAEAEVERDVRNSFASVESSISRVSALERALESSRTGLEATQAGFEAGTRTNVDVLNAIRAESDARTQLSGARYDYMLAMLELNALAGKLGEDEIARLNRWLAD
ncbi:MAG: TolC family outer membrane protein [Pseudomonadota bacterium]